MHKERKMPGFIPRPTPLTRASRPAAALLAILAAACDGGGAIGPEPVEEIATLTVDASQGWAMVDLGTAAQTVTVADASTSTAWDLAFNATSVMLNGGGAGPGGVVGHCVCQNAAATDAQVGTLTAESERADFEAVTAAQIPAADSAWTADALAPAISGWWSYDAAAHTVAAVPGRAWKVRTAESAAAFAKFRVVRVEGATRTHAGRVTFEYALQPAAGAPMGAVRTATVDVSGGRVHFDLARGTVSDASDWDLAFEGYDIRVNGGVSGSGKAGAVAVDEPFAAIADASDLTASHYRGDAYGGVFAAKRWYRYNITGADHQVWPTYDVYLVKRGAEVFKVQITGYYGASGDSRRITFRYAKLAG
jgi:hypothetical protein